MRAKKAKAIRKALKAKFPKEEPPYGQIFTAKKGFKRIIYAVTHVGTGLKSACRFIKKNTPVNARINSLVEQLKGAI